MTRTLPRGLSDWPTCVLPSSETDPRCSIALKSSGQCITVGRVSGSQSPWKQGSRPKHSSRKVAAEVQARVSEAEEWRSWRHISHRKSRRVTKTAGHRSRKEQVQVQGSCTAGAPKRLLQPFQFIRRGEGKKTFREQQSNCANPVGLLRPSPRTMPSVFLPVTSSNALDATASERQHITSTEWIIFPHLPSRVTGSRQSRHIRPGTLWLVENCLVDRMRVYAKIGNEWR